MIQQMIAGGNTAFLAIEGLTPLAGGIPIVVGGDVVGAIGVSGVTAQQDAQIAQAGIDALLR
jgi:glc operon protein GlcG